MVILVDVFLGRRMFAPVGIKDPGPVGVAAPQGQDLIGIGRPAPGRAGKKRRGQPAGKGDVPKRQDVGLPLVAPVHPLVGDSRRHFPHGGGVHVFVVQLHADDRASVLIEQALHLFPDPGVQAADIAQKAGIRGAHFKGLAVQPVRQASVPCLPVGEGPNPKDHVQAVFCAQGHKAAQVPPSGKIKPALYFLHMVPEDVGGDHVHPAHPHLDQLVFPAAGLHAAVMELPGHREKGPPVLFQIIAVHAQAVPGGIAGRKIFAQRGDRQGPVRCQIHDFHICLLHGFWWFVFIFSTRSPGFCSRRSPCRSGSCSAG